MRLFAAVLLCAISTACTTIPDVEATYRHPRADVTLTITRTIGCSALPAPPKPGEPAPPPRARRLFSTTTVVPAVAYSADTSGPLARINMADLNSPLADSSLALDYYEDGRLKGVSSATTGQGAAIVQAVAALVPLAFNTQERPVDTGESEICAAFDDVSPDEKPVTIIYEVREDFQPAPVGNAANCIPRAVEREANCIVARRRLFVVSPRTVEFTEAGAPLGRLSLLLPRFCVDFGVRTEALEPNVAPPREAVSAPAQPDTGARWSGGTGVTLPLRRPARFNVAVYRIPAGPAVAPTACDVPPTDIIWDGYVHVPLTQQASMALFGNDGQYSLPVPRGAPFGGNMMKLGLAESGAITSLAYGNTSGGAAAIGAVGAIGSAFIETDAERAARYQGQADLIRQQQRLIKCRMDPATCP